MGVRGLTAFLDRSPALWDTLALKPQVPSRRPRPLSPEPTPPGARRGLACPGYRLRIPAEHSGLPAPLARLPLRRTPAAGYQRGAARRDSDTGLSAVLATHFLPTVNDPTPWQTPAEIAAGTVPRVVKLVIDGYALL